jgi:glutathione S-transferase
MIDVHYWPTPNGHKVTIFLEEAGLPYKIVPVNIGKGEQFTERLICFFMYCLWFLHGSAVECVL